MNSLKVKKTSAFEIAGKLFPTKDLAELYKYQELDKVKLGDTVCVKNIYGGVLDKQGKVCYISDDGDIYFAIGDIPDFFIGKTTADGVKREYDGKFYNWKIDYRHRRDLVRIKT